MIVSGLKAATECQGQSIRLAWTNPAGTAHVRITRRANDWPYYNDDPCEVIYSGTPIEEFTDNASTAYGIAPAADTYYYYTVLVSATGGGPPSVNDYEAAQESRTFALSIETLDGKDWIWAKVPRKMRQADGVSKSDGGGGGDLEKWITVMGCMLNLTRGKQRGILLNADQSKAPYPLALEKNREWGLEPDGQSYDFQVARRFNERAPALHRIKGTCGSLAEVVKIFTGWDAVCIDGADTVNPPCGGPMNLSTYDGVSPFKTYAGPDSP